MSFLRKKERKKERKKGAALILTLCLVLVSINKIPTKAYAATPDVYSINLGTTPLYGVDGGWNSTNGVKVYFGKYDGSSTLFRVLASTPDTQSVNGNGILLNCDRQLDNYGAFGDNTWVDSSRRAYLNGDSYYKNSNDFSSIEKAAIMETELKEISTAYTVNGSSYVDVNSTDYIFILSAKEADTLYEDDTARANWAHCWLRSRVNGSSNVATFYSGGVIAEYACGNGFVRLTPAFNINKDSVLFTSEVSSSGNSVKSGSIAADSTNISAKTTENKTWKLTLKDDGKSVSTQEGETAQKAADGTVTVPYTYTDSSSTPVNQISVMITDKEYTSDGAKILYYGALDNIKTVDGSDSNVANATTGTGTFVLPSELSDETIGSDYFVYLVAEHISGDTETDYASTPVAIDVLDPPIDNVDITDIETPQVGDTLDTEALCETTGVSDTDLEVTWTPDDNAAEYNTAYTASVTLVASHYRFTDSTTATVNGEKATSVVKNADGTLTVTYEFQKTPKDKLKSITAPASITVANGTSYSDMKLPETVSIVTEGDTEKTAKVTWNTKTPISGSYDPAVLTEQTVTLAGTVVCPESIDENGVELTTSIRITIEAGKSENIIQYQIVSGANSSWRQESDGSVVLRGSGDISKLVGINVDGVALSSSDYSIDTATGDITLNSSYLNTLSVGDHSLQIMWIDGSADTTLTIKEAITIAPVTVIRQVTNEIKQLTAEKVEGTPDTGDNSPLLLIALLFIISGTGLVLRSSTKKKR